jgi:Flp pilus assembly protein TadG
MKKMSYRRLLRGLKRLRTSRQGSAAIELGLLLPVIAGMVVPLADLGMGAYAKMQLQGAVQAGAGIALTNGFNPSTISSLVQADGATLSNLVVTTPIQQCGCATASNTVVYSTTQTPPACNPPCPTGGTGMVGVYVTVSATATYTPMFKYPGLPNTVNLSAQSVVRIQ